jgi:hypothetical protein
MKAIEILAALVVMAILWHLSNLPPTENALIANFYEHRSAYERLKLYLQADNQLDQLASWGIQTGTWPDRVMPPQGDFSRARFDEYLLLLNEAHGTDVNRSHGPHSVLCVGIWGRGFAGSTEHISVCWLENTVPGKQVLSINNINWDADDSAGRHQYFYRKIEGNWYLERDG